MTTYTGTVESFSITKGGKMFKNTPVSGDTYSITITPDGGGSTISFTGNSYNTSYTKGEKITYFGTKSSNGEMLYTIEL